MTRRRNPDYANIALFGAVGLGLYVLYKAIKSLPSAVPAAFTHASSTVADWAETLFPHSTGALVPNATIMLGTGAEIPVSAVQGVSQFTDVDGTQKFQFYYQSAIWRTTTATPDDTNTYYAPTGGS